MPRTPFSDESKLKKSSEIIILLTRMDSEQGQKPVSPHGEASNSSGHSKKELDHETCQNSFVDSSPVHGPPAFIKDTALEKGHLNLSAHTLLPGLRIRPSGNPDAGLGVWNEVSDLPEGVWFGPYEGQGTQDEEAPSSGYVGMTRKGSCSYHNVGGEDKSCTNWMRYVNCARHDEEENLRAFQYHGRIFYRTCQDIKLDCELLVRYSDESAWQLGIKGVEQLKPEMHSSSACPRAISSKNLLHRGVKHSHSSQIASRTSARKHLQSVEPCSVDHSQQGQDADTQSWNNKDESQDLEMGAQSLPGRIRQRGRSGAWLTTCTACKSSSREGGRIPHKKPITLHKVNQEDSGKIFMGGRVPRSVSLKHRGCGQGSIGGSKLERKQNTHSGDRAYAYNEGGPSFTGVPDVITLQRTHSREETSVSKDNGMGYTEKSVVLRHNWTHSGKKPCVFPECGKHFTVKANVNTNKRTHKGAKRYVCTQCRHCFSSKSGLTSHHKAHTEEKTYACRDCGRGFAQKLYLMRHQKRHSAI